MSQGRFPSYGGQALIEGVVMRGTYIVSAAMRRPDGEIIIQTEELKGIYKSSLRRIPILRGLVILWDSLGLGMRFLLFSANLQAGQEEIIEGPVLYGTLLFSFFVVILLFFIAPAAIGQLSERLLGLNAWLSNLVEGIIRLLIVVGYIWAIGKQKDIQRVFAYHGAEHKTINAYEAGVDLTSTSVAQQSLVHPRCGTSFLLTLVILSILVFSIIGPLPPFMRITSRILLLPILAGVAYEYIRWAANHLKNPFVRLIIIPNLALQKLTTREPDLTMIEVAIAAFTTLLEKEQNLISEPSISTSKIGTHYPSIEH